VALVQSSCAILHLVMLQARGGTRSSADESGGCFGVARESVDFLFEGVVRVPCARRWRVFPGVKGEDDLGCESWNPRANETDK